jgi:hypothetical protein
MGRRGFGSLAFNVKTLRADNLLSGGAVNIGATTGAGSSTRKYLYCRQRTKNPSLCLNQIITISNMQPKQV